MSDRGTLFGCGSNEKFQLGIGSDVCYEEIEPIFPDRYSVPGFELKVFWKENERGFKHPVTAFACTSHATLVIDANGRLFAVGDNSWGELANLQGPEILGGNLVSSLKEIEIDGGARR